MLKHHLALADEIIVNEGYSDDGTYEAIKDLDPKIRIIRNSWEGVSPGPAWWGTLSDQSRVQCTSDWCIKLDCDEFIPEWEFDRLRTLLRTTDRRLLPLRFKNFYANYKVLHVRPEKMRWPVWKHAIHRNLPDVHAVGDGSSVMIGDEPWDDVPADAIELHHFGAVRNPARLRQKWRNDGAMKAQRPHFDKIPSFVYKLMPHDWLDKDLIHDLAMYEGPFVKAVRDEPSEFVRDDLKVYEWLKAAEPHGLKSTV
jgi:glycosyltransferase involved in cell wall biosynthesis